MAADYLRNRGRWPGPRRGVNAVGVLAWSVGCVSGLVPLVASEAGGPRWLIIQPACLLGFAVAFVVYAALAALGLEPPALEELGSALVTAPAPPIIAEADRTAQASLKTNDPAAPPQPSESPQYDP
jgi:hypothetical protein